MSWVEASSAVSCNCLWLDDPPRFTGESIQCIERGSRSTCTSFFDKTASCWCFYGQRLLRRRLCWAMEAQAGASMTPGGALSDAHVPVI